MDEFTQGMLIALVPALIVSIITAYLTSQWALRQFYSQKWWELKAEAYSDIVAELVSLQHYFGRWFESFVADKDLSEAAKEKLAKEAVQARDRLTRTVAAGTYLVSQDAVDALEQRLRSLDKTHPNIVEEIDMHYAAVRECIAEVSRNAAKDLHRR